MRLQLDKRAVRLRYEGVASGGTPTDHSDEDVGIAGIASARQTTSQQSVKAKNAAAIKAMATLPVQRQISKEEAEEQALLCRQSVLQFSTVERREATFPLVRPLASRLIRQYKLGSIQHLAYHSGQGICYLMSLA